MCDRCASLTDPSQHLGTVHRRTHLPKEESLCVKFRSSPRFSLRQFSLPSPHPQTGCGSVSTTIPYSATTAEKASDMEVATKTNKATILRTLVTWANIAPTKPANAANSERSRVQLQRPRRLRPQRAVAGRRGVDDGLGNAEVGERQQDAQLPSHVDEQLPELHEGARHLATPAARRACRSCGSTGSGTSRTSASSCRRSSTRAARS